MLGQRDLASHLVFILNSRFGSAVASSGKSAVLLWAEWALLPAVPAGFTTPPPRGHTSVSLLNREPRGAKEGGWVHLRLQGPRPGLGAEGATAVA